jgi:hypothetical protein
MKLTIILIILIISITLQAEIEVDKAFHFTGCLGMYILTDCIAEWLDLPPYLPFLFVGVLSVSKELNDPFFNWKDIYADSAGICVGIGIRFVDRRKR